MSKTYKLTQEQVLDRITQIHGDRYGLSKVIFTTINHKITLVCPEHGDFDILPKTIFIQHSGCNKCAYSIRGNSRRKSVEQFINEATAVHGDKYDYSQVTEYKNNKTKVPIICKEHGVFHQDFTHHVTSKQGCSLCNTGNGKGGYTHSYFQHNPEEQNKPGILYAARFSNGNEQFIKIGITAKSTHHRFSRSEYKNMTIDVLHEKYLPLYDAFCLEQQVLQELSPHRFFSNTPFSGQTECFRVTPAVTTVIQEIFINTTPNRE